MWETLILGKIQVMQAYPNLIFDLGGVIINLDFAKMTHLFSRLSGKDFADRYAHHQQLAFFDDFETGRIEPEEFRDQLRRVLGLSPAQAPDGIIDHHWNAILLDIPAERIALLQTLAKTNRIFLLSNTNAIHKTAFDHIVRQQHGLPNLDVLFEQSYYSHLVHNRKPATSIFQRVIDENALNPQETLFIDDTIRHVEGARKTGLNAFHLVPPTTVIDLFAN